MNRHLLIFGLMLTFTCCLLTPTVSSGQKLNKCEVKDKSLRSLKYRIVNTERSFLSTGLPIIGINISVAHKDINREFLLRLAQHLNQRFCREERMVVGIFDDPKAARYFNPPVRAVLDAWRGEYFLDRRTGEEYVAFSTVPNYHDNPQARIKIELGAKTSP